jgi:hypothetical protein
MPEHGVCCQADGTCNVTTSSACLASGGTFQSGTACPPAGGCPKPPGNDECKYGYQIPSNYSDYYSPDGYYSPYGDNTYGTTRYRMSTSTPPYLSLRPAL